MSEKAEVAAKEKAWEEYREDFAAVGPTRHAFDFGWDASAAEVTRLTAEVAEKQASIDDLLAEIRRDVAVLAGHRGCARGYEYNQALSLLESKYAPTGEKGDK